MKKTLQLILCVAIVASSAYKTNAQHAARNWMFGQGARVDFNPTAPLATALTTINTDEGSSSISDSYGNLLFYTDGVKVWDKNHNQMPNGSGLLGHTSSTHSALIVPCSCNKYFIFTTGAAESGYGSLSYSVVDMTLHGNLGDVMPTAKNLYLFNHASEKLAGVSDGNGGFWVVAHSMEDDQFFSYHIFAGSDCTLEHEGPSTRVSAVGSTYLGGSGNYGQGQMKISPDGTKLAVAGLDYGTTGFIELFKFNKTTGAVSNYGPGGTLVREKNGDMFYGVEFSPDGKRLYATTIYLNNKVFRYNILPNSLSAKTLVKDYGGVPAQEYHVGQLQLAPDGKIYIARPKTDPSTAGVLQGETYLDALTTPNTGTGGFLSPAINLASPSQSRIGLPTMIAGDFSCSPLSLPCCNCLGEVMTIDVSTGQGSSATDPFWKVNGLPAYMTPPDSPWLSLPWAKWLQPVASPLPSHNIPNGAIYSYMLKFTVQSCTIPSEIRLEGKVAGDNNLTLITPWGMMACPGPACYQAPQGPLSFNYNVPSVPGVKSVIVAVRNNEGPSGMIMNAQLRIQCRKK